MESKTFLGKLFVRNAAFRGMKRECAERVMKNRNLFLAGFKADLILKMEIGNGAFRFFSGVAKWKPESLKLCPRLFCNEGLFPK